jgi:hypothetical protein
MSRTIRIFRRHYGASPLHLLGLLASLAVAGLAMAGWFDKPLPSVERVLIWFAAAIVAHDLVLLPLYSLVDRLGLRLTRPRGEAAADPPDLGRLSAERVRAPGWVYIRVPLLLSGLLLLVFVPEILRLGNSTFKVASGQSQHVYLLRYLLACVALFACSALAYVLRHPRPRWSKRQPLAREHADATGDQEG